jgi:hypothetical protein
MYVILQKSGDITIIDNPEGHSQTRHQLIRFLDSAAESLSLSTAGTCPLVPDAAVLETVRFFKSEQELMVSRKGDVLEIAGRRDHLRTFAEGFVFDPATPNAHHHPDQGLSPTEIHESSLGLIVQSTDVR